MHRTFLSLPSLHLDWPITQTSDWDKRQISREAHVPLGQGRGRGEVSRRKRVQMKEGEKECLEQRTHSLWEAGQAKSSRSAILELDQHPGWKIRLILKVKYCMFVFFSIIFIWLAKLTLLIIGNKTPPPTKEHSCGYMKNMVMQETWQIRTFCPKLSWFQPSHNSNRVVMCHVSYSYFTSQEIFFSRGKKNWKWKFVGFFSAKVGCSAKRKKSNLKKKRSHWKSSIPWVKLGQIFET